MCLILLSTLILQDFVELPPDDMQKLLVHNTVSIINIKIARWLNEVRLSRLKLICQSVSLIIQKRK